MSSFSDHNHPSSSQFIPPESAQPYRSLFGGPSSDLGVPPSSLPEPARRSIFGGPAQDVATEPETEAELMDRGSSEGEEDDFDMIMRQQPLDMEYGSSGESFKGSDEEANKPTQKLKSREKKESDGRSTTRSRSRSRSESPTKTVPQPTTYVLDRGLDLPPGVDRPNRWTGNPTTYRRLIGDALATYEGLTTARSRDLAAHLYNSYMVRRESKQNPGELDEDGQEKTTISKRWGAWPLPPSRVPRPNEHMQEWFDDPDTIRMPPDPRPSAELEESIIAVMTRIAKENFLDRDWDYDEIRSNRSRSSADPDAMTDEEDKKADEASSDPSFLQPALQTDDDVSRRQLRPLARNIITRIDSLLTALQRSINYRYDDREASGDSCPGTDDDAAPSRSGGKAASKNGRGRKRVRGRPRQAAKSSGRSRSQRSPAAETEDESMRDTSHSRDRSRNSRASGNEDDNDTDDGIPFNAKLPLRDWSEVMGLASMLGLPRDAVMRASKRCADLFEQDMTFRTFHEGRIEPVGRFEDKSLVYDYCESQSEVDDSDPPPSRKRKKANTRATSQSQRNRSGSREAQGSVPASPPVNMHTIVPGFALSRGTSPERSSPERGTRRLKGKGEHRKADLVCPIKTCSRHVEGFSRTWNLNLHMKRVHPGYQERERSRSRSRSRPEAEGLEVIEID
ncbi:hypothetical protein PENDEC_c014G05003 [Penicillium decumbens]|uniref:Uncharacterized protein n=1 Tax=Penicillium decumbens TaxID=69771 RepID=A0A1V6PA20_PENDC|nr:hypothetical protein PENDEC_c014G05003 [Penicillium decumbens]